ncbi:hypothetical protein [Bosea sp. 124]|uniref:TackOD1 domain-containing metal-binding protein n=1 Tax=Bosea sp. 124 TaxID=2135642 RepID=UPI000D467109|nr:hypothetical protein [Bosea sp. 124]PTM41349.1 hypothetical protein C8D03_2890 [Bosea sp. 124]
MLGLTGIALAPMPEQRHFLAYPRLPDGYDVPPGWSPYGSGDALDAVVLTAIVPDHALRILLDKIKDPLVPIVSFLPDERQCIDLAGLGEGPAWARALEIQARLLELPPSIRYSTQPEDILLARIYSRNEGLNPVYDSASRDLVRYPVAGALANVSEVATALFERGHLIRSFFDRIHCCPQCRSGHLSVREECHSCASANIREELVVHHFQCAHEAPESHFRSGGGFECPKCARTLRHIGLDYDKPGSITRCGDCGAINDKPNVGFKCIDCGAHSAPDQVPARTWFVYNITAAGTHRVLSETDTASASQEPAADRFQILLEYARREAREFGSPCQLFRIVFAKRTEIEAQNIRLWEQSMLLMSDVLRGVLREVDDFREERDGFLVLLPRSDEADARRVMDQITRRAASVLKIDPGLDYSFVAEYPVRGLRELAA